MRVLLVDDERRVRSALRFLIEQLVLGGEVSEAAQLEDLVPALVRCPPDVVLVDWEFDGASGEGVVRLIRETCPRAQVIALSGMAEASRAALQSGVDAFVSKNDPPERVLGALTRLGRSAGHHALAGHRSSAV